MDTHSRLLRVFLTSPLAPVIVWMTVLLMLNDKFCRCIVRNCIYRPIADDCRTAHFLILRSLRRLQFRFSTLRQRNTIGPLGTDKRNKKTCIYENKTKNIVTLSDSDYISVIKLLFKSLTLFRTDQFAINNVIALKIDINDFGRQFRDSSNYSTKHLVWFWFTSHKNLIENVRTKTFDCQSIDTTGLHINLSLLR